MKKRKATARPVRRRRNGKDNRRWNDTLNAWSLPVNVALLIVLFVTVGVMYGVIRNSCESLSNEVEKEKMRYADLMDEMQRERTKWDNMKTPRDLESRLLRHGIAMAPHRSGQRIVRSSTSGSSVGAGTSEYASNRQ